MKKEIPQMQLVEAKAQPTVAQMLSGALDSIQRGEVTPVHVEVLKGMMDLYERDENRRAEKDFAAALVQLQGETANVSATKKVDVKPDGTCRYRFAPYEEIMRTVKPMLTRYGFSVTFDTEANGDRLTSVCTLMHRGGHTRQNRFAVRYSKPPGSSDPQGDMSTKSYAKRGALCDALNIVVEHDDDARMLGAPIGKALADELEARVKACGADREAFLKFAGVNSFGQTSDFYQILDDRWEALDAMLRRKEAAKVAREKLSPEGEWK
jgi:hypothetical protein